MSKLCNKFMDFLVTNLFAILIVVVMSFVLNELQASWWVSSLVIYVICESFHQCRTASMPNSDEYIPINYPCLDPYVNDIAQFFLNKFKPVIIQSIKDCEVEIRETSGLGSFKFINVQIDDMIPNVTVKNVTIFDDTIILALKASLIIDCEIKFSILKMTGQFDQFAINGDLMVYLRTTDTVSSPIESIEISFNKPPQLLMTMTGYLSPFEGIVHETVVKEISGLMVAPNKYIIQLKKDEKANENLQGRVRNLLMKNYNKVYSSCQKKGKK